MVSKFEEITYPKIIWHVTEEHKTFMELLPEDKKNLVPPFILEKFLIPASLYLWDHIRNFPMVGVQIGPNIMSLQMRKESAPVIFKDTVTAAGHKLNIEPPFNHRLYSRILSEIEQRILTALRDRAPTREEIDLIPEDNKELHAAIRRSADQVGQLCCREPANVLIMAPKWFNYFPYGGPFHRVGEGSLDDNYRGESFAFAGSFGISIQVYMDFRAETDAPLLLGYKGSGQVDAGYILAMGAPLGLTFENNQLKLVSYYSLVPNNYENITGDSYLGKIDIR